MLRNIFGSKLATWVTGPMGWDACVISLIDSKDGSDISSISIGASSGALFFMGFWLEMHQSKSRSCKSALRSMPSWGIGC